MERKKMRNKIFQSGYYEFEIAEQIGVVRSQLSFILSGKTKRINHKIVTKLTDVLNCNASDILGKRDMVRYQTDIENEIKK